MSILAAEPAPRMARPSGGVWDYLSPSRLNLWLTCPLKFKLRYIDGVKTPPTPALFLGKRVHDGLETYYRHRQFGVRLDVEEVNRRMLSRWDAAAAEESMRFTNLEAEEKLKEQATAMVGTYLRQLPPGEPRPIAVETSLQIPLIDPATGENLGIPLLGVVDLIMPEEGGPVIIDFKTAARSAPPFEITHEIQLGCYSYLFRRSSGQAEAGLEICSLVKTKTPKIVPVRFGPRRPGHFRRLFTVVRAYLDALDRRQFHYLPSWACAQCEFRTKQCANWVA
jgi:putative RecB family exonuclease